MKIKKENWIGILLVISSFLLGALLLISFQIILGKCLPNLDVKQPAGAIFLIFSPTILLAGILTMASTAVGNQPLALLELIMGWGLVHGWQQFNHSLTLPGIDWLFFWPPIIHIVMLIILVYSVTHSFIYLAKRD